MYITETHWLEYRYPQPDRWNKTLSIITGCYWLAVWSCDNENERRPSVLCYNYWSLFSANFIV